MGIEMACAFEKRVQAVQIYNVYRHANTLVLGESPALKANSQLPAAFCFIP